MLYRLSYRSWYLDKSTEPTYNSSHRHNTIQRAQITIQMIFPNSRVVSTTSQITHETIELTVTGQDTTDPVCNFRYEIHPNNCNKPVYSKYFLTKVIYRIYSILFRDCEFDSFMSYLRTPAGKARDRSLTVKFKPMSSLYSKDMYYLLIKIRQKW